MSRELRICLGVGARKCGAFLSTLDRDPHPTCARCRGKICTRDMTCDFSVDWSSAQWELFTKKRSHKECKKLCPSGSVPPAPKASPRTETPSGVSQPGNYSSSFSRPSGGQDERGGSQGAPGVVSREASSPPARPRSSERGRGGVSLDARLLRTSAPPPLLLLGEVGVARLQRTPLARSASSVASPRSSPHVRRRGELKRSFGGPLPRCIIPWFPIFGSRSTEG